MTTDRSTARLYSWAVAFMAFMVMWASVATHPFPNAAATGGAAAADPQLVQIQRREQSLEARSRRVNAVLQQRWARYKVARRSRLRQIDRLNAQYRRELLASRQAAAAASAAASRASYQAPARSYGASSYSAPAPVVRVVQAAPVTSSGSS